MATDDFPTEEFDAIILGTGLKECILSGLLSKAGKKVLQLDKNDYYGAECASLNMIQMYKNFEGDNQPPENQLGKSRDYAVDLCPKFIIGCGELVKMLIHTGVTRYLEFKHIEGSFVFHTNKLYEVPVTPKAALTSSLLGMFQRVRAQQFFSWVAKFDETKRETWDKCDVEKQTMREIFSYWKCDDNTISFTGHCIALRTDDSYLDDAKETIKFLKQIQIYAFSLARYEKSPYIYPVYGLGGLPEGFSRLSAVHGGTFMLRNAAKCITYGDDGKANGVETVNGNMAKIKSDGIIITDPSYLMYTLKTDTPKIKLSGRVARWICVLDHQVDALPTKVARGSAQIIIPGVRVGRPSDIYISMMSESLMIAPRGKYTATISSVVYTDNPKMELQVAYKMLGKVLKEFFFVTDTFTPINDPTKDKVFATSSMDATTHFQNATEEVKTIYKLITGKDVDLSAKPEEVNNE